MIGTSGWVIRKSIEKHLYLRKTLTKSFEGFWINLSIFQWSTHPIKSLFLQTVLVELPNLKHAQTKYIDSWNWADKTLSKTVALSILLLSVSSLCVVQLSNLKSASFWCKAKVLSFCLSMTLTLGGNQGWIKAISQLDVASQPSADGQTPLGKGKMENHETFHSNLKILTKPDYSWRLKWGLENRLRSC